MNDNVALRCLDGPFGVLPRVKFIHSEPPDPQHLASGERFNLDGMNHIARTQVGLVGY